MPQQPSNIELSRRNQKFSDISSGGLDRSNKTQDKKIKSYEYNFNRELIEPCNCNEKWHRICIREKITRSMMTSCEVCQFQYVAGYTECYAIFNKKRRNFMGYLIWQECIFLIAFLLLAAFTSYTVYDIDKRKITNMESYWIMFLQTFSAFLFLLVLTLLIFRLKALYCHKEIEEIQIFDKSQKSSNDDDSPAILEVYFEDIREYEKQSEYYKKSIYDRRNPAQKSKLGTPF